MKAFDYLKLMKKYNKLELEYQSLQEMIKDHCFDRLLDTVGQPLEIKRLRQENKRLRIRLKALKKEIKK